MTEAHRMVAVVIDQVTTGIHPQSDRLRSALQRLESHPGEMYVSQLSAIADAAAGKLAPAPRSRPTMPDSPAPADPAAVESPKATPDYEDDDGRAYFEGPLFDVRVDPTGRGPTTIAVGSYTLGAVTARRTAEQLLRAAAYAEANS